MLQNIEPYLPGGIPTLYSILVAWGIAVACGVWLSFRRGQSPNRVILVYVGLVVLVSVGFAYRAAVEQFEADRSVRFADTRAEEVGRVTASLSALGLLLNLPTSLAMMASTYFIAKRVRGGGTG